MSQETPLVSGSSNPGYGAAPAATEPPEPVLELEPEEEIHEEGSTESVYSLMLMVPPILHEKENKRCTNLALFAGVLVALNFCMQFTLLVLVQGFVIHEEKTIVESVMFREQSFWRPWGMANEMIYDVYARMFEEGQSDVHGQRLKLLTNKSPVADCHKESLCSPTESGQITCAPPSLQLLGDWDLLDVNGDDLWTLAEASDTDYRGLMKCRFGADPMVLFTKIVEDMRGDILLGKQVLHPNITKGIAIHKAYFDMFLYKPIMCIYGDADMCANMFTQGVFHEAIKQGRLNLANATTFCTELLTTRCEHLLPSTYHAWRMARDETCGKRIYTPMEYASPDGSPDNLMVRVDFERRLTFGNAMAWHFVLFRSVIMLCFLGSMRKELLDMYRSNQALRPGVKIIFDLDQKKKVPLGKRTTTIDYALRMFMLSVSFLRACLWVMLLHTGVIFLDRSNSYLDLIFDAVSLVFIFEIDEMLYSIFVRDYLRSTHENSLIRLPVQASALKTELVVIVVLAVTLCAWHALDVTKPIKQALDCVCLWEGATCNEATSYSPAWWDEYWDEILPQSQAVIKRLTQNLHEERHVHH